MLYGIVNIMSFRKQVTSMGRLNEEREEEKYAKVVKCASLRQTFYVMTI
jgi:hypothetical protein